MEKFTCDNYTTSLQAARILYDSHAKDTPIFDCRCRISAKEIAEDRRFNNITEIWLEKDTDKRRALRSNGIEERFITGDASDYDKFKVWAATLPRLIGNPLYRLSHLELGTYFGYNGTLNEKTCDEVWELCNEKLQEKDMSVRAIIKKSNVKLICTVDDPVDSLIYHKAIAEDESFETRVLPSWSPDKVLGVNENGFTEYTAKLSEASGVDIKDYASLICALIKRLDYFDSFGCRTGGHTLRRINFRKDYTETDLDAILGSALSGKKVSPDDAERLGSALLSFFAREYTRRGWVMQLHYGIIKNANTAAYKKLGSEAGFDAVVNTDSISALAKFFDDLNRSGNLPKTIVYSPCPTETAPISSIIACFQGSEAKGKIQHVPAPWFFGCNSDIKTQLKELAVCGVLGNFIGIPTDSKSPLSYARQDCFRRALCDLIGSWVENGEYPFDIEYLGSLVRDICYNNVRDYFNF